MKRPAQDLPGRLGVEGTERLGGPVDVAVADRVQGTLPVQVAAGGAQLGAGLRVRREDLAQAGVQGDQVAHLTETVHRAQVAGLEAEVGFDGGSIAGPG
ncbi:MAG: hypothetical protein M3O34_20885 [Chloroflexota bacterium]|nr:hypothetical protein [Chloroflexota bacterium]